MTNIYEDGTYLEKNPDWHTKDSPWKAKQIFTMMNNNKLQPNAVCEVGCGAGEILSQLYHWLPENITFHGYEISPQAFELCQKRQADRLRYYCQDFLEDESAFFDLVLAIDLFEHIEDYLGFLRKLRDKGRYKIFHIPLDISVQTVLRSRPILHARESVGHLHYFTKETALATLNDTGYEIIDYFYTLASIEAPNIGFKRSLLKLPRKWMFALNHDLTVRLLGGFSLLVLAK